MAKRGRPKKPTARNVKGRKVSKVDLENLKKAWTKATGPKTPEGKAKSSMNSLKTGLHMRMFHRITNQAGKLLICKQCGEEIRSECIRQQMCLLQDKMIANYVKAKAEKNPDLIEDINVVQVATMDMIFSIKLKYALDHIDDMVYNEKTGKEEPLINNDYMYMLMNMFKTLNKSLEDMQLTRKSIDGSDTAWAALIDEKIDREQAKEYLEKIKKQADELRDVVKKANEQKKNDPDIQEYQKQIGQEEDENTRLDVNNLGDNPFGTD